MREKMLSRIINKTGVNDILEILTKKISSPDLQSLLMEVYKKKSSNLSAANILEQYEKNRFVRSAKVDPVKLIEFDQYAFNNVPGHFEKIILSPLAPLGSVSGIAPVDQNNIVSTSRKTEVVSDPTNILALECALRRKKSMKQDAEGNHEVSLCTSHRVTRAQVFEEEAAFPHFSLFAMATSGSDTGSFQFEEAALKDHICFYLNLLQNLSAIGLHAQDIKLKLIFLEPNVKMHLEQEVEIAARKTCNEIIIEKQLTDSTDSRYYNSFRFQIFARNIQGKEYFLVDGGMVDWTQKLLSNKKERLMTSGVGSERLLFCFRK